MGGTNSNGILFIEKFANGKINYSYYAYYKSTFDIAQPLPNVKSCPLEDWGGPFLGGGTFKNSYDLALGGRVRVGYGIDYREGGDGYYPILGNGFYYELDLLAKPEYSITLSSRLQGMLYVNKKGYTDFYRKNIPDSINLDLSLPIFKVGK